MPAKHPDPTPPAGILHQLDLNLLRVFLEILDAGGVSAAAPRLHLTQPAVSNALARLRIALADELFVRSGRRWLPTAYAQRVAPVIRECLARLAGGLEREPPFEPARSTRWFRLAMTDAGEFVFLPKLAAMLRSRAPGVRLQIVPLEFDSLTRALGDGALDLAIGPLPLEGAGELHSRVLFRERYAGLVRRQGELHKLALAGAATSRRGARAGLAAGATGAAGSTGTRGAAVSGGVAVPIPRLPMAVLRRAPLVLVMQAATLHRALAQAVMAEGLESHVVGRVPHFMAVPPLVAAYDALAVLPLEIATLFAQRGLGAVVDVGLPLAPYDVSVAWHRRYDADPGLAWFAAAAAGSLRRRTARRVS